MLRRLSFISASFTLSRTFFLALAVPILFLLLAAVAQADRYDDGLAAFAAQDYAKAQTNFTVFCSASSQDPRVHDAEWYSARCYFETRDYATFKTKAAEFIQKYPEGDCTAYIKYYLAVVPYTEGKYAEAVPLLEKIIKDYPDIAAKVEADNALANSYYNLRKYPEFRAIAEPFLTKNTTDTKNTRVEAYMAQVPKTYCFQENWKPALEGFDKFLAAYPESPFREDTIYWKTRVLFEVGRYADFEKLADEYLTKYPAQAKNCEYLQSAKASSSINQSRLDEGIERLLAFAKAYPNSEYTIANQYQLAVCANDKLKELKAAGDTEELAFWSQQHKDILQLFRVAVDDISASPTANTILKDQSECLKLESLQEHGATSEVLRSAARDFIDKNKDNPEKWAWGMVYLGIAQCGNTDKTSATKTFDAIIARTDLTTPLAKHERDIAVYFRGGLAQDKGDTETARACALRIRDEMTSSPYKTMIMGQFRKELETK